MDTILLLLLIIIIIIILIIMIIMIIIIIIIMLGRAGGGPPDRARAAEADPSDFSAQGGFLVWISAVRLRPEVYVLLSQA